MVGSGQPLQLARSRRRGWAGKGLPSRSQHRHVVLRGSALSLGLSNGSRSARLARQGRDSTRRTELPLLPVLPTNAGRGSEPGLFIDGGSHATAEAAIVCLVVWRDPELVPELEEQLLAVVKQVAFKCEPLVHRRYEGQRVNPVDEGLPRVIKQLDRSRMGRAPVQQRAGAVKGVSLGFGVREQRELP